MVNFPWGGFFAMFSIAIARDAWVAEVWDQERAGGCWNSCFKIASWLGARGDGGSQLISALRINWFGWTQNLLFFS